MTRPNRILGNTPIGQAVQKCSDARRAKTEERGVYRNTSSTPAPAKAGEVCSAMQQMSVFQQPASRGPLRSSLITQGIGHVSPEAYLGGPIALIAEGDTIRIDITGRILELAVDPKVLEEREKRWKLPESTNIAKGSLLERYRRMVGSAMQGSVLE